MNIIERLLGKSGLAGKSGGNGLAGGFRSDGTGTAGSVATQYDLRPIWELSASEVREPTLAMKVSAVYRCVDIVSGTVASLGIDVLRRQRGSHGYYFGVSQSDPLDYLLNFQPNERQTAFEFWKNAVMQVLLRGNAYILPLLGADAYVGLVLLSPDGVSYDARTNEYHVSDGVNDIHGVYQGDEVIHLRNVCTDGGYMGRSTIDFAGKSVGIATKTDNQQSEMFEQGATLRGFVSGEQSITTGFGGAQDAQLEAISTSVEREIESGRRIWHLPGMAKFNQVSMTPADLQLLEAKRFSILEICRFFGVHPDKVFSQTSTNYQASQNSQTVFLSDTLQPLLRKIENELQVKLIPRSEYRRKQIRFSFAEYFKTDPLSKADYYQKMLGCGGLTVNDVRVREGMQPVAGGDVVMVSCNVRELIPPPAPPKEGGMSGKSGGTEIPE